VIFSWTLIFKSLITITMASAARLSRVAIRPTTPAISSLKSATRRFPIARSQFQQGAKRAYASEAGAKPSSWKGITAFAVLLAGTGAAYQTGYLDGFIGDAKAGATGKGKIVTNPKFEDYQEVYNDVAKALAEHDEYEDGSYGPVIVRLAWHASGTYVFPLISKTMRRYEV
jgi:cytochrome c peroxidase